MSALGRLRVISPAAYRAYFHAHQRQHGWRWHDCIDRFENFASHLLTMSVADVAWIRRALRGETATCVSGVAYQQYSQYADKDENLPLPGATVRLQASGGPALTTVSGADGEYAFDAIAPGEYHLSAARPTWIESYRQKILVRQGGCVERPLRLESSGSVDGIVRKSYGTPARNAEVELVTDPRAT